MAFTKTTLSTAVAVSDKQIVVASATGFAANQLIKIDQEMMLTAKSYVSGTTIPVLRGQQGSATTTHVATANVITDATSESLWALPAAGGVTSWCPVDRGVTIQSISATSTLVLPVDGSDLRVIINGTTIITLTVPVPTVDMDGTMLYIASNGAAAHIITFTSTLNNAGAGYTSFTNNASGTLAIQAMAVNGFWTCFSGPAWTGTVTKVVGGIA
jgi:hypothetical protein